jgi:hypothetical protein
MGLVSCSDEDDDEEAEEEEEEARQVIYWQCAPGLRATYVLLGGVHGDCNEMAVLT